MSGTLASLGRAERGRRRRQNLRQRLVVGQDGIPNVSPPVSAGRLRRRLRGSCPTVSPFDHPTDRRRADEDMTAAILA